MFIVNFLVFYPLFQGSIPYSIPYKFCFSEFKKERIIWPENIVVAIFENKAKDVDILSTRIFIIHSSTPRLVSVELNSRIY